MATASYIIGVVFASVAAFIVWLLYKILIPVWAIPSNQIATVYPNMVNNNPTYVNAFNTMVSNMNLLVQGAFVIMMLGTVFVFVIFYAWRHSFGTTFAGDESI